MTYKYRVSKRVKGTIILLILFWASCSNTQEVSHELPNIVLIMADDMGYSDIGAFGGEIQTPNIDRLARNGLVMTHFYNAAKCVPTRASLLTGLYHHQVGMGDMKNDYGYPSYQGYLNKKGITLAEALKQGGYTTMMVGKWQLGDHEVAWPQNRGFEQVYGIPKGGGVYFYPFLFDRTLMLDYEVIHKAGTAPNKIDSTSFYSTDAFNDHAVKFIEGHREKDSPFFLYLSHVAPHWPLNAPEKDIEKYLGKYKKGFESYRQKRFERQKRLGLLPNEMKLSPPDERVENWNQLSNAEKNELDRKMAVYAAQIDRMDQGIGRIIEKLKETDEYNNTVIMFLSDNGGAPQRDIHFNYAEKVLSQYEKGPIGSRYSFKPYGPSWANVSNTPFRLYKDWTHEGGIATPLIVHWPNVIKEHRINSQVSHVIDIMPTLLELSGVKYPESYHGNSILPMEGKSIAPIFKEKSITKNRTLFWENIGNRAVRHGKWKLVSQYPENEWYLYNMEKDRTELNNLSQERPELVKELIRKYDNWANRVGVVPRNEIQR